jgi:hypothetical protein
MNSIYYNLSFNRRVVLLNDYFPDTICNELLSLIKTKNWIPTEKFGRQTTDLENTLTQSYFQTVTTKHAELWTGKKHKLLDCYMWKDSAGLSYKQHTDVGIFKKWENHLQIYINEGEPDIDMGTKFHHSVFHRKPTIELSYTNNAGYFINTSQSVFHSVSKVPNGKIRYSVYARLGVI